MNTTMIGILVRKDLRLLRGPVMFYSTIGVLSVGMLSVPNEAAFYAGCVLLITALMGLGMHPTISTTVGERKDKTLAFVMSMPIKPNDYTCAKLLANLLMFFVPWLLLLAATLAVIGLCQSIPNGLMPFATILLGSIAVGAVMILCVAVVTESIQLTIAMQIFTNLLFQSVMYGAAHTPSIAATMHGETPVWNADAMLFLAAEAAIALLLFGLTLWRQSRKTDFI